MARNNVLILSAASKVRLVERFKDAAEPFRGKVFVSDLDENCTASFFSDGFIKLPATGSSAFEKELLSVCEAYEIGLIIPTRDGELPHLASIAESIRANGIEIPVADQASLQICQDKRLFLKLIKELGLGDMPCLDVDELTPNSFPVFGRPNTGSGGKGARRFDSLEELREADLDADNYLLHSFIDWTEYSIDALFDLECNPLQAVMRTRENVTAGESKKSRILQATQPTNDCLKIGKALRLKGHAVFQLFWDGKSAPIFIEVNPRFGGASDASIEAGLDSPRRLTALSFGSKPERLAALENNSIKFGLIMQRYSRDIFIKPDEDTP